jgi:hypothetical protein
MKTFVVIAFCLLAFSLNIPAFAAERRGAAQPAAKQPLTYANVVSFFKSAQLRPTEVQKRCTIFFEGKWTSTNIYNYRVISRGTLRFSSLALRQFALGVNQTFVRDSDNSVKRNVMFWRSSLYSFALTA